MKKISFFEEKSTGFKVLVFIILIIIGFSLFNILGSLISSIIWSKEELLNTPNAIRLVMVFGTVGSFFFPAFFYLFFEFKSQNLLSVSSTFKDFLFPSIKQKKSFFLVILLSFCIIPIVAYLGELNQNIKLPHSLENIEKWMTTLENENARVKVIDAEIPLASMFGYATQLRSMTQGRANYSMEFGHYAEVPNNIAEGIMSKK
jgi:hypothetical protein